MLTDKPFDAEPTESEAKLIGELTAEQVATVDATLLSQAHREWRKVALVVGRTMLQLREDLPRLPDVYYVSRVAELVAHGQLEARGDLRQMRFSEVRIPPESFGRTHAA